MSEDVSEDTCSLEMFASLDIEKISFMSNFIDTIEFEDLCLSFVTAL